MPDATHPTAQPGGAHSATEARLAPPGSVDTPAGTPHVTVRRARFVDVPGVARLLTADHPVVDLDGDGRPDAPVDPEQLSSATRLVLSHGILEQGEIWVAEDTDGLRAATVWLPPEGMHAHLEHFDLRPGGGFRSVLTYETHDAPGKYSEHSDHDTAYKRKHEVG